jgi:hypothetical protein
MSINKTLATAALAGLMTTTFMAPAFAAEDGAAVVKAEKSEHAKEKHACKGQNSCKGNGADGKNSCKGKGSCATDGSK